jgi:hypothetical protein
MKRLNEWSRWVFDRNGTRAYAPQCDPSILHAPGECDVCDHYPDWQEYRKTARINFSGYDDEDKAPCPAEHFRSPEIINRWGGNTPKPSDDKVWGDFYAVRDQLERGEGL